MPPPSITTSALSTSCASAVPTEAMRPSSVIIVSPETNGLCQSPETIAARLQIATFIETSPAHSRASGDPEPGAGSPLSRGRAEGLASFGFAVRAALQLIRQVVGRHQIVHHAGRARPIEGAEAVAGGADLPPGVEHLILGCTAP